MKCQMSNVECGMFTVHNCALLFTGIVCLFVCLFVRNVGVPIVCLFVCLLVCFLRTGVPIKQVLFVCLFGMSVCQLFVCFFLKDRCTN